MTDTTTVLAAATSGTTILASRFAPDEIAWAAIAVLVGLVVWVYLDHRKNIVKRLDSHGDRLGNLEKTHSEIAGLKATMDGVKALLERVANKVLR